MKISSPCYTYITQTMYIQTGEDIGFGQRYTNMNFGSLIRKNIDIGFIFDIYTNEIKRR